MEFKKIRRQRKPKVQEPVYYHNNLPVMVKIGEVMGNAVYVELKGDVEQREHDYMMILHLFKNIFTAGAEENE